MNIQKKMEMYRDKCLKWREWAEKVMSEFDGLYKEDYPVNIRMGWKELKRDYPWPKENK